MIEPAPPTVAPQDVPIRDAATVILLRDGVDAAGTDCPQVWLLTRVSRMAFASGMTVFPGGRVDDADATLPWSGRRAEDFAAEFDCAVELARALVGAAVRETFEETGVLLSDPPADLSADQPEVEAGRVNFGDLLRRHGLAIDADRLRPWARWITPAAEHNVRRYDTRFFVAVLPEGAHARDLSTESSIASWSNVAQALAANAEGVLMPPTRATLESIAGYRTAAEIFAAAGGRSLQPTSPTLTVGESGRLVAVLADGSTYVVPS